MVAVPIESVVEMDTDGSYVLSETDIKESDKAKNV